MDKKLNRGDYRFIAVCVVLAAISLGIAVRYFYKAFPEASIDFRVTREESAEVAQEFLDANSRALGLDSSWAAHRHAGIFSHDDLGKVFLERELGLEEANKLMSSQVRLWRWDHRWFQPLEKEEVRASVSPEGHIVRFRHLIEEEAEGARLSPDSARTVAEAFLEGTMGKPLAGLEFVQASSEERPNRSDHTFLWKRHDFDIEGATYRYRVVVLGAKVGGFSEFLKVPESWRRDYEKLRAANDTTAQVAALCMFLTLAAMIVVFVMSIRRGNIKWKTAMLFGLVGFVLQFGASLNMLPLTEFSYDTTESYSSFLFGSIFRSLLGALSLGLFISFLTAAAEPLYRERYRDKLSLTNLFTWQGIRTKRFLRGVILGLSLSFMFGAFQVVFYLVAGKLGGWAPAETPYSDLLNTRFPWIFILLFGFLPAVSEEFISRMFSIPFFEKILKRRWLAVAIPAIIWGFAHANYPAQPFYIRGLEVGVAGVIIGYLMIRYGILPTLIWHFTVDALYSSLLLFRSGNTYFVVTAAITSGVMLIPLALALFAYFRHGGFASHEHLTNEQEGTPEAPPEEAPPEAAGPISYKPLSNRRIAVGLAIAGGLAATLFIPAQRLGQGIEVSLSKDQAVERADEFLSARGIDPGKFRRIVFPKERYDSMVGKYILMRSDVARLNQTFTRDVKALAWGVRYYQPLEKEEHRVYIDPADGGLVAYAHDLEEDAEGASISEDSARVVARQFLEQRGYEIDAFVLKKSESEDRKARRDFTFEWEARPGSMHNLDEAKLRLMLNLQGDQVSFFNQYIKLPEEWVREREKKTALTTVHLVLRILVWVGFGFAGVFFFVTGVREGRIPWRFVLIGAGVITAMLGVSMLNNLSSMLAKYITSVPFNLFLIAMLVGIVILLAGGFLGAGLGVGTITALYPGAARIFQGDVHRRMGRDAGIVALITFAGFTGVGRIRSLLLDAFPRFGSPDAIASVPDLGSHVPLLSSLSDAALGAILMTTVVAVAVFVARRIVVKGWLVGLVGLLAVVAYVPLSVRSFGEFSFELVSLLLGLLWVIILLRFFARDNYLAYPAAVMLATLAANAWQLGGQPELSLRINGIVLAIVTAAAFVWLIMQRPRNARSSS